VFFLPGTVTGGTGKLEGATGNITFEGVQNVDFFSPSFGVFVEDITGVIFVDLSPN
jgi:hypothetical protein